MNFISKVLIKQVRCSTICTTYRHYPRWTSRKPLHVLSNEEYEQMEKQESVRSEDKITEQNNLPIGEATQIKWRYQVDSQKPDVEITEREMENDTTVKKNKKKMPQKVDSTDMFETTVDSTGRIVYTKMKNNDTRIAKLLTTVKSKKDMNKKQLILLEGKRLICDALMAGCTLKYLLFSRRPEIEYLKLHLPDTGAKIYKMPYREMQLWSDLTTCPGIMGLFKMPNTENYLRERPENERQSIPLTIFCDNVREPSNLGAILRVAASVGCHKVLLSSGCTNLWDSKVTRTSAGSHFHVQIQTKFSVEQLRNELATADGNKVLYIADNNTINTENVKESDLAELVNGIPLVPYYSVDVKSARKSGKDIVLVIGGETKGISADIYQLAKEFNGIRLNIPMSNGVDSLNTGTALGVISFEFYRQFISEAIKSV